MPRGPQIEKSAGSAEAATRVVSDKLSVARSSTSPRGGASAMAPKSSGKGRRTHNLGDDGLYTSNRKGTSLCVGVQSGSCQTIAQGTAMISAKTTTRTVTRFIFISVPSLAPGRGPPMPQ